MGLISRHRLGTELVLGVVVVAAGIVLRFFTTSDLWLDEALTVNISSLSTGDLLDALRQEAHPPVYYLLQHGWMLVFGEGDVAVRSLPGVCSLLALPLAWFAGSRLAGRAGGWAALLLLASSPFAIRYASEARMYALVVLLVLAVWLALRRALERPTALRLLLVGLLTGVLLLTHYWALYLLVAAVPVLAWRWRRTAGAERAATAGVLLAVGLGAAALVPWAAYAFADQARVDTTFGASRPGTLLAGLVVGVTSGEAVLFGIGLVVLAALALFARPSGPWRMDVDLTSRSPVTSEAVVAVLTILAAALAGWLLGVGGEARHTSVAYPLLLLVAAYGVTRLPSWSVRTVVVAVVSVSGIVGAMANAGDARTQAGEVASALRPSLAPGDLVVYCPDQLGPSVSRLLPDGVRSRSFPETDLAPERVEWVGYDERLAEADPVAFARTAAEAAGPATVWLVWYGGAPMVGGRCAEVTRELERLRPASDSSVTTPSESQDAWFEKAWLARFPGS